MDKEIDKFFDDLANNTPNESMFDINEVEEDLVAGKPFSKLKEDLATSKKGKKEKGMGLKKGKENDRTIKGRDSKRNGTCYCRSREKRNTI